MLDKKIFIKTFGCQMNEYDSNRIYDSVSKLGFVKTSNQSNADCYILNTCHIRDKAKEKVYHEIGRVKKLYKNKKKPIMIIAGCVAQAENEEMFKREPYIDIILGPQSYHKVNNLLTEHIVNQKQEETEFDTISKFGYFDQIKNNNNKISAFLTIQEGCDKFCHFCVVPYTRGPEYSRPFKQIIAEAEQLIENGVKEITLLGQNVNAYSYLENNKEYRLSHIINCLNQYSELVRIRYTTSHPRDMTEDLIECYSSSQKLMPFVHLPIQSGSNRMLELMNRKHTVDDYLNIYERLKEINEDIEFSSDFIVGYPGEKQKDFEETFDLIKEIKFINSFSFIFSPRPGTIASKLDMIDKSIAKERLTLIQEKLFSNQIEINKSMENQIIDVLVENKMEKQNKFFGRNKYITPVIFDGNDNQIGKNIKVKIQTSNQNTLFGSAIKNMKAA
ncbi:MAG: tRNA (N6-isopentenyl adenosine(37)-C2)-methylthiotransferase MiaB [Pseudomonadota bacterium]|jgi:tRNA-2-methylthio-N6-dimethylallyladenosine synthase|nr:tRNA (N6-isopentenyl adenosine(37)-C2)-methylthiotransferase MiaB [Pseudomonadota bacterium]